MRILLTLLILATIVFAAPPRTTRTRVRIPVWTDGEAALSPDNLTAEANGETAEIVEVKSPKEDLLLLVVLDMVADLNEIDLARGAITSTVAELPTNVYVGLLRAQDGLTVLVDPTEERDPVMNAVDTFTVSGAPGLLETIETASTLADSVLRKSPVRIAICYVTDGDIRDYREDFTNPVINYSDSRDLSRRFPEGLVRERISKLESKLASAQAPIFIVQLEYYSDRLNEAYQSGMMQLTSVTGGETVVCRSNSEIPQAIEATLRKIANHYSVDLQVAGKEGDNLDISLESPAGALTHRARVQIGKPASSEKGKKKRN